MKYCISRSTCFFLYFSRTRIVPLNQFWMKHKTTDRKLNNRKLNNWKLNHGKVQWQQVKQKHFQVWNILTMKLLSHLPTNYIQWKTLLLIKLSCFVILFQMNPVLFSTFASVIVIIWWRLYLYYTYCQMLLQ